MNDFIALAITFILSILWLRINDFAAQRGWISGQLSRKIIHIGTGPLFVLCWLLFSPAPSARYLAAMVPLLITVQFFLVGIGVIKDEAAVQAMSRTGNPREILRGPLIYGLVFVVLTIWFWKDSPVGMLALMLLCGGDGLADIVGRRWGKARLPWNHGKSYLGSLGMLAGGWLLAVLILGVFVAAGEFPGPLSAYLPAVTWIALAGALVESLPIPDIDNLTISAAAVALGLILF
jgi:phytol kinase